MVTEDTGPAPRGSEKILLVEPEAETRKLAAFMLSKIGYQVLEARNAGEACRLYQEHGPGVDLLLTEAPMSKVNGHELAQMLSAQNPGLRVLYLSDPDYERLVRRAPAAKSLSFVHRPFTMKMLAGKVRQVLDAKPAAAQSAG